MSPISRLIIISIVATITNCEELPLWSLLAGETVNANTLNLTSVDFFWSFIFNDYHSYGSMLTIKEDYSSSYKITYNREICTSLESLKPLLYPKIYLDNVEIDWTKLDNSKTENRGFFDTFKGYLDETKYKFGILKVCRVIKKDYLAVDAIKIEDLPIVGGSIVHKVQKLPFGVLRFKRGNETHYVSSSVTGNCIFQIVVNTLDICNNIRDYLYINKVTAFFNSPIFKSKIIEIDRNYLFETVPEYSNSDESLYDLMYLYNSPMNNRKDKTNLLELKLLSLPEVPKFSRTIKGLLDVKPGDVIEPYDFGRITSSLKNKEKSSPSAPSTIFNYSHCFEYNELAEFLDESKFELSPYKLDLFREMVVQNNYGVAAEYLTKDYKCYKVTVCSGFYQVEAPEMPSINVIDLEKFLGESYEYNIVYQDNVVMRRSNKTKLYYVSRMGFGDCLFQAMIYPASTPIEAVENRHQLPVYKGRIISASRNNTLEELVRETIFSYEYSIGDDLINLKDNVIKVALPVINLLTDTVPVEIYLKSIN